jgi:hypothetical protein
MKLTKLVTHSRVDSRVPHPLLGTANTTKKSAAKSRGRIQVVLEQTKEGKEDLSHVFSDSDDEVDDPLGIVCAQPTPEKDVREEKRESFNSMVLPNPFLDSDDEEEEKRHSLSDMALPNPFLDSDDDEDDFVGGELRETRGARSEEEPESDREVSSFDSIRSSFTILDVPSMPALKSCLRVSTAPNRLVQYHFHLHSNPDDIWTQMLSSSL